MSQVDQFESVFRSALRDPFELSLPTAESLLVVTDLAQAEANALSDRVVALLKSTSICDAPEVRAVGGDAFSTTTGLLERVDSSGADLICTYTALGVIESGAANNVWVDNDNSECSAADTPFDCCTGSGSGTCEDDPCVAGGCKYSFIGCGTIVAGLNSASPACFDVHDRLNNESDGTGCIPENCP